MAWIVARHIDMISDSEGAFEDFPAGVFWKFSFY
jgi:hypothetical protein